MWACVRACSALSPPYLKLQGRKIWCPSYNFWAFHILNVEKVSQQNISRLLSFLFWRLKHVSWGSKQRDNGISLLMFSVFVLSGAHLTYVQLMPEALSLDRSLWIQLCSSTFFISESNSSLHVRDIFLHLNLNDMNNKNKASIF